MARPKASITTFRADGVLTIRTAGCWRVMNLAELARILDEGLRNAIGTGAIETGGTRSIVFDLSDTEVLDTAGAWVLLDKAAKLARTGIPVRFENPRPEFAPLLRKVEESRALLSTAPAPQPRDFGFVEFLERLGRRTLHFRSRAVHLLGFFGLICIVAVRSLRHPSRIRLTSLVYHMEQTGVNALPIVGLLTFLIGVVFAYQGADQLRRFGAEIYTVNLTGLGMVRELGVLITSIVVAGRSGSAFAAQIGTMKVNEEIDAMRTLGLDPVEILVLPRLYALMLTLPLLVFYANIMGLIGAALMSWGVLDLQFPAFLRQLHTALPAWNFWIGLIKAPFFAAIIGTCGCYEGLRVHGSAESVGKHTTRSVVESIFLVITADAIFSVVFSYLHI